MSISTITTDRAPRSTAPLSQAVLFGEILFTSGQVPVDPATNEMVDGGIREQTRQVMDFVLKTTCFLTDFSEFAEFNEVYAGYFPQRLPARSTVEVSRLAGEFRVEIEAIVSLPR